MRERGFAPDLHDAGRAPLDETSLIMSCAKPLDDKDLHVSCAHDNQSRARGSHITNPHLQQSAAFSNPGLPIVLLPVCCLMWPCSLLPDPCFPVHTEGQ